MLNQLTTRPPLEFFSGKAAASISAEPSQPNTGCYTEGLAGDEGGMKAQVKLKPEAEESSKGTLKLKADEAASQAKHKAKQEASHAMLNPKADMMVTSAKIKPEADRAASQDKSKADEVALQATPKPEANEASHAQFQDTVGFGHKIAHKDSISQQLCKSHVLVTGLTDYSHLSCDL